ncbi:MAG: hypothetical protein JO276_07120 [Sphingomonadaceae bacterium]|nr:hypothetical protein [Sphingomonadaceae bacterium]
MLGAMPGSIESATLRHESKLPFRYRACGLAIASDIALPGLLAGDGAGGTDLVVEAAALPEELNEDVLLRGPNWQRTREALLLRVPGVGRFRVVGEAAIQYQPEGGQGPEDLTAFLTGSMLGILLHLRGDVVIHASAVLAGDAAILFCGASGAGKSTLAAALGQRGYAMLADDLSVLRPGADGVLRVAPDGRCHKLWERSLGGLGLGDRRGDGVRHQINKYYVPPRKVATAPAPVAALYELEEQRGDDAFGLEPLSLPDAAHAIRANAFRARMMWRLGQGQDYFRCAAQIARQGRMATLRRPFDFARLDAVLDLLEADWAGAREQGA